MIKTDTGSKIKMAAVAILNWFNGHNSVAVARIGIKFDVETKTNVQKTVLPSDFTFEKFKMAATPF